LTGSVSSSTHPLLLREDQERLTVTLPQQGNVPDRDFVLRWKDKKVDTLEGRSVSCIDQDSQYVVVRLDSPEDAPVVDERSRDYYFLVDRSGSMRGKKWTCTVQALRSFANELGKADRVWITLFESSFQDFAETPLPVSQLRDDPAFHALEKLGVTGGTELAPAVEHVLEKISTHSTGRDPVIILITDGQVGNETDILKLLRARDEVEVHTFGIDTAVNGAFLKGIAVQNRGACVLMTPDDDIQGAVSRLGMRLRRPVMTSLKISPGWEVTSSRLPDVHSGEHILVVAKGAATATHLKLTGRISGKALRTFRFDLKPEALVAPRLLWARQTIDRLLAESKKSSAIELAIKHNLICEGTAFIAFDLKEKVVLSTQEIYQPAMVQAPRFHARAAAPATTGAYSIHVPESVKAFPAQPQTPLQLRFDRWQREADALPALQGSWGTSLRDLLGMWATRDPSSRLALLEKLLQDLHVFGLQQAVDNLLQLQLIDPPTAESIRLILGIMKGKSKVAADIHVQHGRSTSTVASHSQEKLPL
jgi:Ca-activated chloride channel family protein